MIIVNPDKNQWDDLSSRPQIDAKDLMDTVAEIFRQVELSGDEALRTYTSKFDGVELEDLRYQGTAGEIDNDLADAMKVAKSNIEKFHKSQVSSRKVVETTEGVFCWQENRPLETVGLYIPGGTAPLFSTVLMLAIPAQIAKCQTIILCTPPDKSGKINPAILYAAKLAGVTDIFSVGGAQAIAAMAKGTESIPRVQKIFGPGNQYVTAAKKYASSQGVLIDMPAGPSELLVVASTNSIPEYVAADLLSQAEHGVDSQVICLAHSHDKQHQIILEIQRQIENLPRKEVARQAIDNSKFIVFPDKKDVIDFINTYAPEHLIIADDDYEGYISQIQNAGSVFLGNYCPESAGDYASGTNHTLPTSGYARIYSGVNMDDFVKKITFQSITKEGLSNLGPTIETMALAENLHAHKNAVTIRLTKEKENK